MTTAREIDDRRWSWKVGCVAFLDILGFKGIWQNRDAQEVLDVLSNIPDLATSSYIAATSGSGYPLGTPETMVLSDTIVITFEAPDSQSPERIDPRSLTLIVQPILNLLTHMLEKDLLVRGAIGCGRFSRKENVLIGPAVDDVALWYEAANWLGVLTTPKASRTVDLLDDEARKFSINDKSIDLYLKYEIPLKSGKTCSLNVLNWPSYWEGRGVGSFKEKLTYCFSRQYAIDASVHEKYDNTLRFVDAAATD